MNYTLAYGRSYLSVDLPADLNVSVVESVPTPSLDNPLDALTDALQAPIGSEPLASRVSRGEKVGIVVNDITRHTPTPLLLRAIRETLSHIPDDDIAIFVATGTHRANTASELEEMLGGPWADRHKIYQNDALDDSSHVAVGRTSSGNTIWLNQALMDCDFRIATGFIEPHIFAGFSGGGKAFLPGMAGMASILHNHSVANVDHHCARWGIISGNPIAAEIREATALVEPAFLINVALNQDHEVARVFAGDMQEAHLEGCSFVKEHMMVPVAEPFDIVLTSNAGYPLDLNIYQSIKGMSAAAQITKKGGSILIVAECWDGIPDHGDYARLMQEADSLEEMLDRLHEPGYVQRDSWQVQIQASISMKTDIYLHSHLLDEALIRSVKLQPATSIDDTVEHLLARYGREARICVMPEGPLAIPFLLEA